MKKSPIKPIIVSGVYLLGTFFAIANVGITSSVSGVDLLTITGLTAWTLASARHFYHQYQLSRGSRPNEVQSSVSLNTQAKINNLLQMTAATSFFVNDARHLSEDTSMILSTGIRMTGAVLWFSNTLLGYQTATIKEKNPSDPVFCMRPQVAAIVSEVINETGALCYLISTGMLWEMGYPMPLKLSANLCWSLAAAHELIEASRAVSATIAYQEVKPEILPDISIDLPSPMLNR